MNNWLPPDGRSEAVWISRCFPWPARTRFISLRDDERSERALIEDSATLDTKSRETLEDALVEADFVLDVVSIDVLDRRSRELLAVFID